MRPFGLYTAIGRRNVWEIPVFLCIPMYFPGGLQLMLSILRNLVVFSGLDAYALCAIRSLVAMSGRGPEKSVAIRKLCQIPGRDLEINLVIRVSVRFPG